MNNKSQITMFVILGLVLLIIVIILFSIERDVEPRITSLDKVLNELKTGSIKNHVSNCIVQTASEGIEKIGANGGFIYDFEGGNIPFGDKTSGQDYLNYTYLNQPLFVAYGLRENILCSRVSYAAPDYPYLGVSFDELTSLYESCLYLSPYSAWDGFFGQNTMTKMCSVIRESSCQAFARGAQLGLTIQKQLEDYVANEIPACVNFSAFTSRMTVDIITESKPRAEATIYDSEIGVIVKYPVKIIFEDQEPITQVVEYYTPLRIRLGMVYNFLYTSLSSKDSKDISFDITNQFIESSFYKDGLLLTKINNPCTSCSLPFSHDDIIEVKDTKSLVNGKPFLFRTAVMNRKPALNLTQDLAVDIRDTNFINLPLEAYDPDDAGVTYYFLSLGFGRTRCTGTGSFTPTSAVIQAFDSGFVHLDSGLASDDSGLASITGMQTVNIGEPCVRDDDCLNGEQGPYAGANAFPVPDSPGWVSSGYYLKCAIDNTCRPACGPSKTEAYICPYPGGLTDVSGPKGQTLACFKARASSGGKSGRCINSAMAGNWESCFHPNSPTGDACVSSENGWFYPHGADLRDGYHCMWTSLLESNIACECGSSLYPLNRAYCFPANCVVGECCDFCTNGKMDCGETSIDAGGPCDTCTGCDVPPVPSPPSPPTSPPLPTDSAGSTGWCEQDSRISGSSGELARPAMLSMPVNKYDSGEHRVGILVVDDSGLFDYQQFWINITDTTTSYDATGNCVGVCGNDSSANINNCDYWCTIAANQCRSECGGGDNFNSDSTTQCGGCIYPIYYSRTSQNHIDCALLNRQQCINNMPDCFWIREKSTGSTFIESCYNDNELSLVNHPAYILVS